MLTVVDVDNIVSGNFVPDIKKLADELGAHLNRFSGGGGFCVGMPGLHWTAISYGRKKTTKAEAIARHIDALVTLLRNEPDTIVGRYSIACLSAFGPARAAESLNQMKK